jgi:hypothetical protein
VLPAPLVIVLDDRLSDVHAATTIWLLVDGATEGATWPTPQLNSDSEIDRKAYPVRCTNRIALLNKRLNSRFLVGVAVVGVAGFEPTASSSRTKRATKLRHTPLEATTAYRTDPAIRQSGLPGQL